MSLILTGFCLLIFDIMMTISFLFLLRGHNHPGGGFIASLIAIAALGVYFFSFGTLPRSFLNRTYELIAAGIFTILISAFIGLYYKKPLLSGIWWLGHHVKLGTPVLFDLGVYLILLGSLSFIFSQLELKKT